MQLAESRIQQQGGRLIVLETSSQELYRPTQEFHQALGYREVSRIPDFYAVGDDRIAYTKKVSSGNPP
jgi:ribosomal protein S18 acetylase RimI-like enzyme